MPNLHILFDSKYLHEEELISLDLLINSIVKGTLRDPEVKKLKGIRYQNKDVFRAKIDYNNRLIFSYVEYEGEKTLLLHQINNHDYDALAYLEHAPLPEQNGAPQITESEERVILPVLNNEEKPYDSRQLLASILYKNKTIVLDTQQAAAVSCKAPLVMIGPPGSGKTTALCEVMQRNIAASDTADIADPYFLDESEFSVENQANKPTILLNTSLLFIVMKHKICLL